MEGTEVMSDRQSPDFVYAASTIVVGLGDPLIDMAEGLARDSGICRVIGGYGGCDDTPSIVQGKIMTGQLSESLLEVPVNGVICEPAARPSAP